MLPRRQDGATLSPHRAFVVHLGPGPDGRRRRFRGRVEHLASGQAAPFSSLRGLLAFFAAVIDAPREPALDPRPKGDLP